MTMAKADLIKIIGQKIGFKAKESTEAVEQVFDILKETLEGEEKVKISGFGKGKGTGFYPFRSLRQIKRCFVYFFSF